MNLHPHAAGLLPILDPGWRAKIFRGGLVLCVPFVGWPTVMGYRARFVHHLFSATSEPLPSWSSGFARFLREGLCALGVIFGYLAPLYLAVGITIVTRGFEPDGGTLALALAFAAFPIFSTLSFPIGCILLATATPAWISTGECVGALAIWSVLIFFVPAGFLQVSLHGRYRAAFAVWRTLPFVVRNLRAYCAAWWYSSLMGLTGHLTVPVAPWGVVWCYLGILGVFNEVLVGAGVAPGIGWLDRALHEPDFRPRPGIGRFTLVDGAGQPLDAVELGAFAAPLPRVLSGRDVRTRRSDPSSPRSPAGEPRRRP